MQARLHCPYPNAKTVDNCRGILLEKCDTDLFNYVEELRKGSAARKESAARKGSAAICDQFVDPEKIRLLVIEVLRAYKECHSPDNRTSHRDVKPQNILVNHLGSELTVKLCDFAASAKFKTGGTIQAARPAITEDEGFTWASPEMLQKKETLIPLLHDLWGVGW